MRPTALIALTLLFTTALHGMKFARASGFYITQVGGPDSGPTEANPSAVFWNPAALGGDPTPAAMLDASYFFRTSSYTRSHEYFQDQNTGEWLLRDSATSRKASLSNRFPFPFAGFSHPAGEGVFGIGAYAPFGSSSEWDDPNGAQKYFSTESTLTHYYVTPAYAHPLTEHAFVGFGFSYVRAFLDSTAHADIAATLTGGKPESQDVDAIRHLDNLAGNAFSGILGVFFNYDSWRFGASFTTPTSVESKGVFSLTPDGSFLCRRVGCRTGDGGIILDPTPSEADRIQPLLAGVTAKYTLPASLKSSFDYYPTSKLRTRLYMEWVDWSSFDAIRLETFDRRHNLIPERQVSEQQFQDAFGVRLGFKYAYTDRVSPFLGGSFDSNAIPDSWLTPATFDSNKMAATLGADVKVAEDLSVKAAFVQVLYGDRTVDLNESLQKPAAPGKYTNAVSFLNVGIIYRFGRAVDPEEAPASESAPTLQPEGPLP
ncbi:MAG: outer membrane protein transport protein [Nitrospirae bacterium]|nr:outer membrane protein transport protein [Nitrospirota bacterium]